jgi:hypothetical protein
MLFVATSLMMIMSQFKEVLEMRVCILTRQAMELACLLHRDEASAKLEVSIPSVDSQPNGHIGNSGGGIVMECLGHA